MPRGLFRKITPRSETLRTHWALKPFSRFFGDPRLWSLQRRTVTPAFGAGLAICFVPLPIHIPLAAIMAIFCRIHIPTIMVALLVANPLTIVPLYLLAYKVGVIVTGAPRTQVQVRDELGLGAARPGPDVETLPRGLRTHRRVGRARRAMPCSTCCGATTCARDTANARAANSR